MQRQNSQVTNHGSQFENLFDRISLDFKKEFNLNDQLIITNFVHKIDDCLVLLKNLNLTKLYEIERNNEIEKFLMKDNYSENQTILAHKIIKQYEERVKYFKEISQQNCLDKMTKQDQAYADEMYAIAKQINKLLQEQGEYCLFSIDILKRIHENHSITRSWLDTALLELKKFKKVLSPNAYRDYKDFLQSLQNKMEKEILKIENSFFIRVTKNFETRISIADDDMISHLKLIGEDKTKINHDELFRKGLSKSSFQYFMQKLPHYQYSKICNKSVPRSITSLAENSGFWQKLPRIFTAGRRLRSTFVIDHVYELRDIEIKINHLKALLSNSTTALDAALNTTKVKHFQAFDEKIEHTINLAKHQRPKGVWSYFFKRKTKAIYDAYIDYLNEQKMKIQKEKKQFIKELNHLAKDSNVLSYKDINYDVENIIQVRHFIIKEENIDSPYLQKTHILDQLIKILITPSDLRFSQQNMAGIVRVLPETKDVKNIIEKAKKFIPVENVKQLEALKMLEDLILAKFPTSESSIIDINQNVRNAAYRALKEHLIPLVGDSEDIDKVLNKIVDRYIIPRCWSLQCPEYKFLMYHFKEKAQMWLEIRSKAANDALANLSIMLANGWENAEKSAQEKILESIGLMIDFSTSDDGGINYYENFIIKIKIHIINLPHSANLYAYKNLMAALSNQELSNIYEIKCMFTNDPVDYEDIERSDYFKFYKDHYRNEKQAIILKHFESVNTYESVLFRIADATFANNEVDNAKIYPHYDRIRYNQLQQLITSSAPVAAIKEFITNINNSSHSFFPRSNINRLNEMIGDFNYNFAEQQKLLISEFSKNKLRVFCTNWLLYILKFKVNQDFESIKSPFDSEHSSHILFFFGEENFKDKILPAIEDCLNASPHPKLLPILEKLLPEGIERAYLEEPVQKKLKNIRNILSDKIHTYQIQALYPKRDKVWEFILQLQQKNQKYPLTEQGREEFNFIVGKYQEERSDIQMLLYLNLGDAKAKRKFCLEWLTELLKPESRVIDCLPKDCTDSYISTIFLEGNNEMYQQILDLLEKYVNSEHIRNEVLPILEKFVPHNIELKFINKDKTIKYIRERIKDEKYIHELLQLKKSSPKKSASISEINDFINKNNISPKTPKGKSRLSQTINHHVLPYSGEWGNEQKTLIQNITPQKMAKFHKQWLLGLLDGSHQNYQANPLKKDSSLVDLFAVFEKSYYEKHILPMIKSFLTKNKIISNELMTVLYQYLPQGIENKFKSKETKALVIELQAKLKLLVRNSLEIQALEEQTIIAFSKLRTQQISKENTDKGEVKVLIDKTLTMNPLFPQTEKAKIHLNLLIKYNAQTKTIIFDSKWATQQKELIAAYRKDLLPAFYKEWFVGLVTGKHDHIDITPMLNKKDVILIYGETVILELLPFIKNFFQSEMRNAHLILSVINSLLPDGIEKRFPDNIELLEIKSLLNYANNIQELLMLKEKQASIVEIERYINSTNLLENLYNDEDHFNPLPLAKKVLREVTSYDPNWSEQQRLLLTSFKADQAQIQQFNRDWFLGLLNGLHNQMSDCPLNNGHTLAQMLYIYGFNNEEELIAYFLSSFKLCLNITKDIKVVYVIQDHLEKLSKNDDIAELLEEINQLNKHDRADELASQLLDAYKDNDLQLTLEILNNQYILHQNFPDHLQFLIAKIALEKLSAQCLNKIKLLVIENKINEINDLLPHISNCPYFPNKQIIQFLGKNQAEILEQYNQLNNLFKNLEKRELAINDLNLNFRFDLIVFFPMDMQKSLSQKFMNFSKKLQFTHPIKKVFEILARKLTNEEGIENNSDWLYIINLANFKLICNYLDALKQQKKTHIEADISKLQAAIEKMLESPYTQPTFMPFWQKMFNEILVINNNNGYFHHYAMKHLLRLEKFIEKTASVEQKKIYSTFKKCYTDDNMSQTFFGQSTSQSPMITAHANFRR